MTDLATDSVEWLRDTADALDSFERHEYLSGSEILKKVSLTDESATLIAATLREIADELNDAWIANSEMECEDE